MTVRRPKAILLFPLLPILLLLVPVLARAQDESLLRGTFWADGDTDQIVASLLQSMSDEEKIAQLLLVGWPQDEPTVELMQWIRERNLGGVKIFGWNGENIEVLAASITTMQEASLRTGHGIPLFTATDQEGGWVRHIKDGTSITPGNMAIGASGLPYDALQTGYYIGMELRAIGINMNFAPTVDVYTNSEAHVIGPRAFSSDPVQTGLLGTAYFRGLERAGVIATAKHFPGHGSAQGDSHSMLPVISDDWNTVWDRDLVPFRMLVREGIPAVLSGHLSFPNVTGNNAPASFSPYFKTEVLRNLLHFAGIVITDDLYMGGALEYGRSRGWSFSELCKEAILAGNDMIMLSQTPDFDGDISRTLIDAMHNEPRFRERVDESVGRILDLKLDYLRREDRVPLFPDPSTVRREVPNREGHDFFLDQAGRSITVTASAGIPFVPGPNERILLAGKDRDFFRIGETRYPSADIFSFNETGFYSSSGADRARFSRLIPQYDTIIFLLSDPNSLQVLQEAASVPDKIIVYSILTPVYLEELPWVKTALAAYGWGNESFEAGFAVLHGDYTAEGTLPISPELISEETER